MKTTKEIIKTLESIGHDPQHNDYFFKKWFSEEELTEYLENLAITLQESVTTKWNSEEDRIFNSGKLSIINEIQKVLTQLVGDKNDTSNIHSR